MNSTHIDVTIAIATWNSADIIVPTLESIRKQELPAHLSISILAVDGGSSDHTYSVCKKAGARILHNPQGDPVSAKILALAAATSTHIMYLDHDERLLSQSAIANTIKMFAENPDLKIVWQSGYDVDSIGCTANLFASEFGDPYSKFIYGNSAMADRRINDVSRSFSATCITNQGVLFRANTTRRPLLLEAVAAGTVAELTFLRRLYENYGTSALISPLRYMSTEMIGVAADSPIQHDSAPSWSSVRAKIRWRVANAINTDSHLHVASGRHGHLISERNLKFRNILYALYCLTLLPVIVDYSVFAVRRKRVGLLWAIHLPIYVVAQILGQFFKKRLFKIRYSGNYAGR